MSGGGLPTETFGPYQVYEELGVGGMAQVHRAETSSLAGFTHQVALKRMLPHLARDADFVKSFVREARLASHLRHNNVAQTYELGKVGDIYFIAMELVTGPDLRQVLRHCLQTTGPMPVAVTLNILCQLCEALDYAHNLVDDSGQALGIIHRDVSPSNIIVADDGTVKLIDFGIAKASAAGMQTASGAIKGKFGYMAPEYVDGTIDSRADLFAIGVIAHELLTNRPLFSGRDDLETLNNLRAMTIDPPSRRNRRVPREVDDVVMTALARNPEQRWHQASAMRAALATVIRQLGLIATNSQVSQWVASAFAQTAQPAIPGFSDDTDADAAAYGGDSSAISMSISVDLDPDAQALLAPAVTVHARPPGALPLGTPWTIEAQVGEPRPGPLASVPPEERRSSGLVPRVEPMAPPSTAGLASPGAGKHPTTNNQTELGVAPAWQLTERPSAAIPVARTPSPELAVDDPDADLTAGTVTSAPPAFVTPPSSRWLLLVIALVVLLSAAAVGLFVVR